MARIFSKPLLKCSHLFFPEVEVVAREESSDLCCFNTFQLFIKFLFAFLIRFESAASIPIEELASQHSWVTFLSGGVEM